MTQQLPTVVIPDFALARAAPHFDSALDFTPGPVLWVVLDAVHDELHATASEGSQNCAQALRTIATVQESRSRRPNTFLVRDSTAVPQRITDRSRAWALVTHHWAMAHPQFGHVLAVALEPKGREQLHHLFRIRPLLNLLVLSPEELMDLESDRRAPRGFGNTPGHHDKYLQRLIFEQVTTSTANRRVTAAGAQTASVPIAGTGAATLAQTDRLLRQPTGVPTRVARSPFEPPRIPWDTPPPVLDRS
jgi:hypothetical protein